MSDISNSKHTHNTKTENSQKSNVSHRYSLSKKPLIKWLIVALLVIGIISLGYYKLKPTSESPSYITATVEKSDIENSVMASGKVKAINTVNVGAQVSGEVTKLYVDVGDVVKKGDLIAQIDEVTQQNELRNSEASLIQSQASLASALSALKGKQSSLITAQASLKTAQANHTKAQADLQKAETHLKRLQPLLTLNAISKQDYDNAKTDVITAMAAVHSAQASIQTAKANLSSTQADIESSKANVASQQASVQKSQTNVSTAKEDLGYTTIRAPMEGTVVSVTTEEGSTVNAKQSAPTIVTLADLSRVRINAQISEADVVKVKAGLPVYFNTIGNPDEKINTSLAGIEPAPEKISGNSSTNNAVYYIGYVEAPNPDGHFRIDMTAQIYIVIDQATDVITIPSSSIQSNDKHKGQSTVQVLNDDGSVESRQVAIGINNRVTAQVLNGLKVGEQVIISQSSDDNSSEKEKKRKRPM